MCELQWDALAEIYLQYPESSTEVYCLCSRAFIRSAPRTQTSTTEQSASEEEQLIDDEYDTNESETLPASQTPPKQDNELETLSCYCSASHTDNLSTDEHDSLRETQDNTNLQTKGLQQSDSGADLTECLRNDFEIEWQKFWSIHGEKLIWQSWIATYSDYINPEYLQGPPVEFVGEAAMAIDSYFATEPVPVTCDKFTFDDKDLQSFQTELSLKEMKPENESKPQRSLRRDLSGSDEKLYPEMSEGWTPLSPSSVEGETEAERLISSRCGSHASSSLRTVDSMTNVTRMTLSSADLSPSSSSSDSFSSVSSVQSSISSEASEKSNNNPWGGRWETNVTSVFYQVKMMFKKRVKDCGVSMMAQVVCREDLSGESDAAVQQGAVEMRRASARRIIKTKVNLKDDHIELQECLTASEDAKLMLEMDLPIQFGRKPRSTNRKESPSALSKVESTLDLLGLQNSYGSSPPISGHVLMEKKRIRTANRTLKKARKDKPRHSYFDEDGNLIEEKPSELRSLCSDSTDNTGDEECPSVIGAKTTVASDLPLRRKRTRKCLIPQEIKENSVLRHYWSKRFRLFHKFDQGIKLDMESWYSVTPEVIAENIAERCKGYVVIDAFCGAGGNTIQFALKCELVIAIDIDPVKIDLCRNNAQVYGVEDKIVFLVGDFLQMHETLCEYKADVVFMSPPWGGPNYQKSKVFDLEKSLLPVPYSELMKAARKLTPNICAFLPKNSDVSQITAELATQEVKQCEVEQCFSNDKLTAVNVWYNDLMKKQNKM